MLKERDELHELIDKLPEGFNFQKIKLDFMKLIFDMEVEEEEVDEETKLAIQKGEEQIKNGEIYTFDEVFGNEDLDV